MGFRLSLEEVNALRGFGTLSQIKQSAGWVKCIGLEGQIGKLKPYVTNSNEFMGMWFVAAMQNID